MLLFVMALLIVIAWVPLIFLLVWLSTRQARLRLLKENQRIVELYERYQQRTDEANRR